MLHNKWSYYRKDYEISITLYFEKYELSMVATKKKINTWKSAKSVSVCGQIRNFRVSWVAFSIEGRLSFCIPPYNSSPAANPNVVFTHLIAKSPSFRPEDDEVTF